MNNSNTPYSHLEPSLILDAIESIGFQCDGRLHALNSYENRVYQVGIEEQPSLVAKFYRPNRWSNEAILEEHQFALELNQYEVPVVAPLQINNQTLHQYQGFRFALFPIYGGRTIELDNLQHLQWMGRFIGRLHAVGAVQAFQHRKRIDVQTYGHEPYQYLIDHHFIPNELKSQFCALVENLLNKIEQCFKHVDPIRYIRLHGDCHAGNVLWSDAGPHIVDLDDCLMGPAIQDIWMLLSANQPHELEIQLNTILNGYQEFHEFNWAEINLIEALRTLRMIHYDGWLAKRWQDPAFPLNFPWFHSNRYWQEQLRNLEEQMMKLNKI